MGAVFSTLPPSAASPLDGRPRGSRRTIAVFIDFLDTLGSGYDEQLCTGFEAACQAHDCNLIFAVGRPLCSPDPISAIHNEVYKLVHSSSVDGLILISAGLSSSCGLEQLERLCRSFQPMALCSLGLQIPSVPSIVLDNHSGMRALMEHIIADHGCQRVAFIGGPQSNLDAAARLNVCREVLEARGLSFEPQLTAFADFTYPSGLEATYRLIDSGTQFEALIAANDAMALGAVDALKKRGLRVPGDVRVVGFDDLTLARFSNPPLTTVRQPLERMAVMAVQRIVAQWKGEPVPASTCQPASLVKRRSCGCHLVYPNAASRERHNPSPSAREFIEQNFERMRDHLNQSSNASGLSGQREFAPLLLGLRAEVAGQSDAFLAALDDLLEQGSIRNDTFDSIQSAIGYLREEFVSIGALQYEHLWDGARRSVSLANSRWQSEERTKVEASYQKLLSCSERFSGAPDLPSFGRVLAEELPHVPINNVLVALCKEAHPSELELLLVLCEGEALPSMGQALPAAKLLRFAESRWARRRTCFVLPLTFECQYLGVVIFEPQAGLGVCAMLREQINFAVKSIALHQELGQKTALHERSVKEQLAATARIESLRVMAGGVAHDLNSALSPLVTLPEIILGLLKRLGVDQAEDGKRLRYYLETIGSAANRATQTIRDLMTIGRQGRTQKAPLDLNWIVASCVSAEPQLASDNDRSPICVSLQLHPTTLPVNASQHHVERAISNLVRNAIEAIGLQGTISIATGLFTVNGPILGHESAAPGTYATVAVSDTGAGIPADMLGRVFEPFFTSKKLGDKSGSGLGLSIVDEVVKEHDGFIYVVSEYGQGTTFVLYFPLATPAADSIADLEPAQSQQVRVRFRENADDEGPSAIHDKLEPKGSCDAPDGAACRVGS